IFEAGGAAIAPDTDAIAIGDNVQPAVIIIIHEQNLLRLRAAQRQGQLFLHAAKNDFDFALVGDDKIVAQIIIEITNRDGAARGPVRREVGLYKSAGALFGEEQQWLAGAGHESARQIFVVPILDQKALSAGQRRWQAR